MTVHNIFDNFLLALLLLLLCSNKNSTHAFQTAQQPSYPFPMPTKWPIVGTLPDFLARGGIDRYSQIYEEMYTEYGQVFAMSIMGDTEIIISNPEVYNSVCRKEGKFPIGGAEAVTNFRDYYEETNNTLGLYSLSHGPEWRVWRNALEEDMYKDWEGYLPSIANVASKISKVAGYEITESKNIAFVDFLSRSAFDMFYAIMYGESPCTTDSSIVNPGNIEFVTSSQNAFDLTGQLITNPMEKIFGGEIYRKFKLYMDKTTIFAREKTAGYMARIMTADNDAIETPSSEMVVEGSNKCPIAAIKNSFVGRLVNRGELSSNDILSLGTPMLMAGVDTTAYVMSWLYLNLATNPNVQARLAQELRTVLNGADVTTVEQIQSLTYLKACIRESHRLTPPTPMMIKTLQEDTDVVIDGVRYDITAGVRVGLNLRGYPMDSRYVDNPQLFLPERFLPDAVLARKGTLSEIALDHPAFADPFGRGKRRCLGSNLAIAEITILAARLIQDYELCLIDPTAKWKPKQKLMLKAHPYPDMKLVRRVWS